MTRSVVIWAALAVSLGGCGTSADPGPPAAASELRVEHVLDRSNGVVFVEGSIWHLRVVDAKENAVFDRKLVDEPAVITLEPGRYRLESEELPCDGNCSHLDPGTDGCSDEFVVGSSGKLAATVTLRPTEGCRIKFVDHGA